jgi:hypothetical protein
MAVSLPQGHLLVLRFPKGQSDTLPNPKVTPWALVISRTHANLLARRSRMGKLQVQHFHESHSSQRKAGLRHSNQIVCCSSDVDGANLRCMVGGTGAYDEEMQTVLPLNQRYVK